MLNEKRVEELLTPITKIIQAPSYSGQESLVVDVMKKLRDEYKFTDIHVDRYGNCICHIKGSKPGPKLLFDSHMDMAPVPGKTKWEHDPLGVEIVGGGIYGRGASNMRGVLSAILAAALYYAEGMDYSFPGDTYVTGVVYEECFEDVAVREISACVKLDYVITDKASQLSMKIDQRGRARIVVETFGVPAHSASLRKCVSTAHKTCRIVEEINKLTPPHHDVLGDGVLELVDMKSSPYPGVSIALGYYRATYDKCLLTDETKESVLAPLQEFLDCMMKEDPQLKVRVSYAVGQEKCWTGETIEAERFFSGWLFGKNEDQVQNIYKEMKEIGLNSAITSHGFYANASHYAGETGIRYVSVGPSLGTLAHTINEYIEIDQLDGTMESYYEVMKTLLK